MRMPGFAGAAGAVAICSEAAMPCGSAAPFEAVEVEDGVLEVWVPGAAVVVAGAFCAESTMVDCDEEREKVLEKGAPRWVSLSSVVRQLLVPWPLARRRLRTLGELPRHAGADCCV